MTTDLHPNHLGGLCCSPIALGHSRWIQPERFASHPGNGAAGPRAQVESRPLSRIGIAVGRDHVDLAANPP